MNMITWLTASFATENQPLKKVLDDGAHYIEASVCLRTITGKKDPLLCTKGCIEFLYHKWLNPLFDGLSIHAECSQGSLEKDHVHVVGELKSNYVRSGTTDAHSYRNTIDNLRDIIATNEYRVNSSGSVMTFRFTRILEERQIQYCYKQGDTRFHRHPWPEEYYLDKAVPSGEPKGCSILAKYEKDRPQYMSVQHSRQLLAKLIIDYYREREMGFSYHQLSRLYNQLIFKAKGCDPEAYAEIMANKLAFEMT